MLQGKHVYNKGDYSSRKGFIHLFDHFQLFNKTWMPSIHVRKAKQMFESKQRQTKWAWTSAPHLWGPRTPNLKRFASSQGHRLWHGLWHRLCRIHGMAAVRAVKLWAAEVSCNSWEVAFTSASLQLEKKYFMISASLDLIGLLSHDLKPLYWLGPQPAA